MARNRMDSMDSWRRLEWQYVFSVELPAGWTAREEGEGRVALFAPAPTSCPLFISCARRPEEDCDDETELALALAVDHAAEREWPLGERDVDLRAIGEWPSAEMTVTDGDTVWQVWHVVSRRRVAQLSYHCNLADHAALGDLRRRIVNSFRWLDSLEN